MQIEQKISTTLANRERDHIKGEFPFALLNMERQPTVDVRGSYNEERQVWENNTAFCKENLMLQRTPTLTGTQTQAGRQLDVDRDQD